MNGGTTVSSKDLAKLQLSAVLFVLLLAAGLALVYWVQRQSAFAQIRLREATQRHNEIESRLRRVSDEEQEIKSKAGLFKQIEARRIVGPEQRLDWVEAINTIIARRKLFPITYEISPQQAMGTPAGPYQYGVSTMKFQLPLLHENDLTSFLADLRLEAPAIVQLDSCRVQRSAQGSESGLSPNLVADCSVRWITLQDTRPAGVRK